MHAQTELTKDENTLLLITRQAFRVIVEHPLYGQFAATEIYSRNDADVFLNKSASAKISLLSNLSDGGHLHTIYCSDHETVGRIKNILREMGILYSDK
jgi:transcriptional regulator of NAD metabolism